MALSLPPLVLILSSLVVCIGGFGIGGYDARRGKNTRHHHYPIANNAKHYGENIVLSAQHFHDESIATNPIIDSDHNVKLLQQSKDRSRRSFVSQLLVSTSLSSAIVGTSSISAANAFPFGGGGSDKRQLELCLVTILRTEYWAMNVAKSIDNKLLNPPSNNSTTTTSATNALVTEDVKKLPYLEARLGAKALLTQKVGGGASSRVERLATYQLKECLADAKYWCGEFAKNNQLPSQLYGDDTTSTKQSMKNSKRIICDTNLSNACDELIESLGSLVEFDGLENTTEDSSPRSSLMLRQYTQQKGSFVYRTLKERVLPSCENVMKVFGSEKRRDLEEFVMRDYAAEVPIEILEQMYEY